MTRFIIPALDTATEILSPKVADGHRDQNIVCGQLRRATNDGVLDLRVGNVLQLMGIDLFVKSTDEKERVVNVECGNHGSHHVGGKRTHVHGVGKGKYCGKGERHAEGKIQQGNEQNTDGLQAVRK